MLAYQGENDRAGPEGREPSKDKPKLPDRPVRVIYVDATTGLPMRSIFARANKLDKPIFEANYSYPVDLKIEAPQACRRRKPATPRTRVEIAPGRRHPHRVRLRSRPGRCVRGRVAAHGYSQSRRSAIKGRLMPKRTDIKSILIIGAGPIVIGQACEFDYSGTQACKALKAEGYRIILVNSNPATIMTDPELADATYIEPITPDIVAKIIEAERPDALLPTMGGQTALNTALALHKRGVLEKFGVEMIGARAEAIDMAEDRQLFREAMDRIGLESPRARSPPRRPSATRKANRRYERRRLTRPCALDASACRRSSALPSRSAAPAAASPTTARSSSRSSRAGIDASPVGQVLIDESLLGWKEYEMEVVRDKADNCIIICSIENVDPMGVHTGDSITVAPALTLTDKEYQMMRNASIAVLREIGVETGGSNVQFAVNPEDGRLVVIEMNPRVSRSSALASKATGFPIAKVAAKLAVGYTLDELANDITGGATPASFEPTIDYVVTKIPRFAFEKFPGADTTLTTSMKSVGEVDGHRPHVRREPAEGAALHGDGAHRPRRHGARGAGRRRRQERDPRRRLASPRPTAS